MSLQYIIDAYNLINHPQFKPVNKVVLGKARLLVDFISCHKLSGSKNNRVTIVFDGYPLSGEIPPQERGMICVFSRMLEADEIIKKLIEASGERKNIIVVSDDKEVQLAAKLLHARVCPVQEFICGKKRSNFSLSQDSSNDDELSYSKKQQINAELKEKWLK